MSQRIRWAVAYVLGWTAAALVTGSHSVLTYAATGDFTERTVGVVATLSFAYWYSWIPAGLLAIGAARRISLTRDGWLRTLAVHVPMGLLAAALVLLSFRALRGWAGFPTRIPFEEAYLFRLGTSLLTYGAVVGTVWFLVARRAAREAERRATELSADLSRVRLEALRARLAPHFLFNTLNSIQAMVTSDPEAAEDMLGDLGDLLRGLTDEPTRSDVSLARELRLVEGYLRIQKRRLEERLSFSTDVEEGLGGARVPPLILQPLVENAVEHAVAPRREGGRIEIDVRRDGNMLRLRVRDDGPGLERHGDEGTREEGVGLSATAERLATRYGERGELKLEEEESGGVRVTVSIPLHWGEGDEEDRP